MKLLKTKNINVIRFNCFDLFYKLFGRTYHRLFFPALDVLTLRFGEMIPNLLVTGSHEQSLNLTDYIRHTGKYYTIKPYK